MSMCLCREPSLNELMEEPIVRAVMARDAVEESDLRKLLDAIRAAFDGKAVTPGLAH